MHFAPPLSKNSVKILDDPPLTKSSRVDHFIETVILCKIEPWGYRNQVRANLRLLAAFHFSSRLTLIYVSLVTWLILNTGFIAEMEAKDLVDFVVLFVNGFFAVLVGYFWKEKIDIHNKWKYLSDLYNQALAVPHAQANEYDKRELLFTAFAMDALKMGMWAHNSFREVFHQCLEAAIRSHAFPVQSADLEIAGLNKVGISECDAESYLAEYQGKILEKSRSHSHPTAPIPGLKRVP